MRQAFSAPEETPRTCAGLCGRKPAARKGGSCLPSALGRDSIGVGDPDNAEQGGGPLPENRGKDEKRALFLERELRRMVHRLRQLGAVKVILFGSYARGRVDPLTDLDLIVVLESDLPYLERTAGVYRWVAPRVAADILVYTPEEWANMQGRPFVQRALTEGRVVYEARAD